MALSYPISRKYYDLSVLNFVTINTSKLHHQFHFITTHPRMTLRFAFPIIFNLISTIAPWQHLPFEIRDTVLYFFALQIIDDYTSFGLEIWKNCCKEYYWYNQYRFQWPNPVACLQQLSWVLRTSKYFRTSLNTTIIDGRTPVEILQELQYSQIREIVDDCKPG